MLRLELREYRTTFQWNTDEPESITRYSALSAVDVLEHLPAGPAAEDIEISIIQESGRTLSEAQVARAAYACADYYPHLRVRFAACMACRARAALWPWDDLVPQDPPPASYERLARWALRNWMLGDEPAGWLVAELNTYEAPIPKLFAQ